MIDYVTVNMYSWGLIAVVVLTVMTHSLSGAGRGLTFQKPVESPPDSHA